MPIWPPSSRLRSSRPLTTPTTKQRRQHLCDSYEKEETLRADFASSVGEDDEFDDHASCLGMAIFTSGGKASKRTTPRHGSGSLFSSTPAAPHQLPQQQQPLQPAQRGQSHRVQNTNTFSPAGGFAPEKTGDNSPPLTLLSMDAAAGKPPSGQRAYAEKGCLLDQKPESMVAESLRMKGELEFTRLLRVDGRFEGDLITDKGSLVVGPKGEVIGDLKNMQEVYVEGIVRGNVFAHDVKVKNNGMLFGDIQCLCLTLDPTASIKGLADTVTLKEPSAVPEANAKPLAPPTAASSAAAAPPASAAQNAKPPSLNLPPAADQGVADTATLKERAILDANPAPPSASSAVGGPPPSAAAAAPLSAPVATVSEDPPVQVAAAAPPPSSPPSASPTIATSAVPTDDGSSSTVSTPAAAAPREEPKPSPAQEVALSPSAAAPSPSS